MIIDMTDFTVRNHNILTSVLFLTGKFKNGYLLGFWSYDPGGCTTDQEKGWAVIDPDKKEVVDEVDTRTYGEYTGEYREWRKEQKAKYGRMARFLDEGGDIPWKMED